MSVFFSFLFVIHRIYMQLFALDLGHFFSLHSSHILPTGISGKCVCEIQLKLEYTTLHTALTFTSV